MSNTQLAKAKEVRHLLNSEAIKAQIAKALPAICTPDRFMRISITAITKNPKLAECTQESLMACLLDCAQLGIEPDGRRAHLIPFNNRKENRVDCTLIIDYKGLVELALRSGKIANIHADKICDNDEFVYNAGKVDVHRPNFKEDRGAAYAYYAQVEFKDGSKKAEVMTLNEVNLIKARSKTSKFGPWVTDFDEMAKKTVFKRLSKWLPLSPEDAMIVQSVTEQEFDFEMPKEQAPPEFTMLKADVIKAFESATDIDDLKEKWQVACANAFGDDQEVKDSYMTIAGKFSK